MADGEIITQDEPEWTPRALPDTPSQAVTLFGTDDPALVVTRAQQASKSLMGVVRDAKLSIQIRGEEYLRVEAWMLLGSMVGVFALNVWTRPLREDNQTVGWEARVEARTRDGSVVGAAEAMCMRAEKMWASRDEHMLRSMAQTRATSKALSMPLRFIAKLAGFEGTPAEEMPTEASSQPTAPRRSQRPPRAKAEIEEIPGTDRPFREGDVCPACAVDGNRTSRGGRPAFFIPKQGPHAGNLQCSGRTTDGGWANHPAPLSPQEIEAADADPKNAEEIPFA